MINLHKKGFVLVDPNSQWDVQTVASSLFDAKVFGISLVYKKNCSGLSINKIDALWSELHEAGYRIYSVDLKILTVN